jgi:hypothetical protein
MHGAVLEGTGHVALIIEPAKSADGVSSRGELVHRVFAEHYAALSH